MDETLPQWELVKRINRLTGISKEDCLYVFLLTSTFKFEANKDIQFALHITKKPLQWFVKVFTLHGVRVEYGTVFTKNEHEQYGPIAQKISLGIVERLLQRYYSPRVKFVGPKWFFKQLPTIGIDRTLSYDSFSERLFSPGKDSRLGSDMSMHIGASRTNDLST
jgi:hypothetical protein